MSHWCSCYLSTQSGRHTSLSRIYSSLPRALLNIQIAHCINSQHRMMNCTDCPRCSRHHCIVLRSLTKLYSSACLSSNHWSRYSRSNWNHPSTTCHRISSKSFAGSLRIFSALSTHLLCSPKNCIKSCSYISHHHIGLSWLSQKWRIRTYWCIWTWFRSLTRHNTAWRIGTDSHRYMWRPRTCRCLYLRPESRSE
jgi:hypothetical protein